MKQTRYIAVDVRDVGYALNWHENNRERISIFPSGVNPCIDTTNPVGDGAGYYTAHRQKGSEDVGTLVSGPSEFYLLQFEGMVSDFLVWKQKKEGKPEEPVKEKQLIRA